LTWISPTATMNKAPERQPGGNLSAALDRCHPTARAVRRWCRSAADRCRPDGQTVRRPGSHTVTRSDGTRASHADELDRLSRARSELVTRGAAEIPHPGGTLLAHLERVHARLDDWGARPALRLAGLCHAYYGTDGFPVALGDPARRAELATVTGEETEHLVYFYAACDRDFSYPRLSERGGPFRNRFTGAVLHPSAAQRRDFAELTAANELDVMTVNPDLRAQHGAGLLRLFTSWRDLLSDPARQAVQTALA
jgi:hypothetical protein